jgi:AmmeMemoRadiSam system protein B
MLASAVRPAAVAGMFYPASAAALRSEIDALLQGATLDPRLCPKVLIVPHAGYVYSGSIAASAYVQLEPWASQIRRVLLLGPVHRVWTPGLALPEATAFSTPLGTVAVDREALAQLADLAQVNVDAAAHAQEHSLEVQLPFLQRVLHDFRLVPLVVGGADAEQVAEVIERLWGGEETLIVISTDLSHYLPYPDAQRVDRSTARAIEACHSHLAGEQACGAHALNGLLLCAQRRGLKPQVLDLRNSGDTAGDKARVVGYGAFVLEEVGHA